MKVGKDSKDLAVRIYKITGKGTLSKTIRFAIKLDERQ